MKVKAFVLMALLGTAAVSGAHGLGLGAQFNYSAGSIFAPGVALLVSPSDKTNIAVNWFIGKDYTIIGLAFDVIPLSIPLTVGGSLAFNIGVGIFANTITSDITEFTINGGLRVPIGLSLYLGNKMIEIFTHVAPSFGVDLVPSFKLGEPFYPIAVGARVWLR
jgi:hypothetical protein